MLAGTIDTEGMVPTKAFIARYSPNFPVGEGELIKFQAFGQWSPMVRTFVPFLFFIDKKGVIRAQYMGSDTGFFGSEAANIRQMLDKLVAESAPASAAPSAVSKPVAKAAPVVIKKKAS